MDAVRKLLADCTLEAVAHRRTESFRKATDSTSVADAVKTLRENAILSIPVLEADSGQFSGVFSATDLLRAVVKELHLDHPKDNLDEKVVLTSMAKLFATPVSKVAHSGELWYTSDHKLTVLDAVEDMILRGQVHHRLFTCETLKNTAPTGILCQSDVVRLLWEHRVELNDVLSQTVEQLHISEAAAVCMDASEPLVDVLAAMFRDHKSCMGITHCHELVGNLSMSDLCRLTPDLFGLLLQPVGCFVLAIRGLPQPKEVEGADWGMVLKEIPLHLVTPTTTLGQLLDVLATHHVHRVYVRDSVEDTIGIITLTDVLRLVVPQEKTTPCEGPAGGLPCTCDLEGVSENVPSSSHVLKAH